jgi:serine O-acetyltransferase
MSSVKKLLIDIKNDFPNGNLNLRLFLVYYFFSPRFRILLNYRLGNYFLSCKSFFLRQIANYYKSRLIVKRNCDISYKAIIGKNLKLPHPIGIVIGEGVVIKDNVMIFQHVTLGSHGNNKKEMQYPTVESGVKIYPGVKIIGGITIGENAIIGANAFVNIDIPANSTAVGIPCKILINKR